MVICLERDADVHITQLVPLSLASVKSRLVLPFWYRHSCVVLDKRPLNGCVCVLCIAEAESCRAAARGSSASATTAARASCRNCGTTADDRSSNGDCDNDRIIVDCSSAGSGSSSGANACDRVVVGGRGSAGDRRDLRADCVGDNVNGI